MAPVSSPHWPRWPLRWAGVAVLGGAEGEDEVLDLGALAGEGREVDGGRDDALKDDVGDLRRRGRVVAERGAADPREGARLEPAAVGGAEEAAARRYERRGERDEGAVVARGGPALAPYGGRRGRVENDVVVRRVPPREPPEPREAVAVDGVVRRERSGGRVAGVVRDPVRFERRR